MRASLFPFILQPHPCRHAALTDTLKVKCKFFLTSYLVSIFIFFLQYIVPMQSLYRNALYWQGESMAYLVVKPIFFQNIDLLFKSSSIKAAHRSRMEEEATMRWQAVVSMVTDHVVTVD